MASVRLDHFITYIDAPSIDEYLRGYHAMGFSVMEHTVRHEGGLRNGFVGFGPEYVEFCWVEDEDAFAKTGPERAAFRAGRRPCAIGLVSDDVQGLHDAWTASGHVLPPVFSKAARDTLPDAPPRWSFQPIPEALQPGGARCAVLTYLFPRTRPLQPAPNTTYAIAGVTFVSETPRVRATAWRDLLAPEALIQEEEDECHVTIGPHDLVWLTAGRYRDRFGRDWQPAAHPNGELAVLHILATDIATVVAMVSAAGREVKELRASSGERMLFLPPDPRDGVAFLVTERPREEWRMERVARTGETL